MGNLMGGLRYKEPSTVEECDSTWETDSESEEQPLGVEEDSGTSDSPSPGEGVRCSVRTESFQQVLLVSGIHMDRKDLVDLLLRRGKRSDLQREGKWVARFGDTAESSTKMKRSFYAAKDLYKYRHSYPNYKEPRQANEYCNLRFYLNKIPLIPDGIYVEEILTKWKGDYDKLEHNHTYIQWLFPLREQGLNYYAQELTQDEIKEFQNTREAKRRFLLAYAIMLDFFGMKLLDKNGNVARAVNWQDRFQHLNESQHNYLRITRILKSLGELGFENFKPPLVQLLLQEALVECTMPNMRHSALEYFVYTVRAHSQRRALLRFAQQHYQPPEHFIWGPPRGRGLPGGRGGKAEPAVDWNINKARSPKQASPNSPRSEKGELEGREAGEWKTAKFPRSVPEGRGRVDIEEYIETDPL